MSTIEDAKKRIAEKIEAQKTSTRPAADLHLEKYLEAYEAALDKYPGTSLVGVNIPNVGMCLFHFAHTADQAAFTREIHKSIELGPCRTYATKCVIFPDPQTFSRDVADKNPEGFVKAALAIKTAMRGEDEEEGKD